MLQVLLGNLLPSSWLQLPEILDVRTPFTRFDLRKQTLSVEMTQTLDMKAACRNNWRHPKVLLTNNSA